MTDNHYPGAYITLDELVQQYILTDEAAFSTTVKASDAITTEYANVIAQLKDFILEVSEELYIAKERDFLPYRDTLEVFASDSTWRDGWSYENHAYIFHLYHLDNRDLLGINSITLDGVVLDTADYRIDKSDGYPAQKIVFNAQNVSIPTLSQNFSTSLQVDGIWGYHESPGNMWRDSGDTVQDAPLSAGATSLTVVDADNFETYQYIRIEDEYLFITALDTVTNILTVERGKNGTSAAAHVNGTQIDRYHQMPAVAKEVTRMVIRAYAMKNGIQLVTAGETIQDISHSEFKLNIPRRWTMGG